MALKRKRSDSELCSSPSSSTASSVFGSPPHAASAQLNFLLSGPSPSPLPLQLHSRTMKRYRNNRPTEEQVHQHTLDLLYSAQQPRPSPSHNNLELSQPAAPAPVVSSKAGQQSLHRFWNIHSAPSRSTSSPVATVDESSCACEDCGASIGQGNGDDGMDVDGCENASNAPCGACGKIVCFSCSVSNLGEQKRCLQCAGTNGSGGSVGWSNAGASIFQRVRGFF